MDEKQKRKRVKDKVGDKKVVEGSISKFCPEEEVTVVRSTASLYVFSFFLLLLLSLLRHTTIIRNFKFDNEISVQRLVRFFRKVFISIIH